jgi:hypothetical protein
MRRVRSQFLGSVVGRLGVTVRGRGVSGGGAVPRSCRGSGASGAGAVLVVALGLLALGAGPAWAADCPNADIRAAQGPAVEALPDCMGLEMVSPPRKFSQGTRRPSVSADGERVLFRTPGGVGDPSGMVDTFYGDGYVASRNEGGWNVEATTPPDMPGAAENLVYGITGGGYMARSFSPDFSRWLMLAATPTQRQLGVSRIFAGGLGGVFGPISPLLVPIDGEHGGMNVVSAEFHGASADHSRYFFRPGDLGTAYLAGDLSPAGGGAESNLYVAGPDGEGDPSLGLVARDGGGMVWGGRCGARLGGRGAPSHLIGGRDQGAVSYPDGDRVFFTTRPGQTGTGVCDSTANKLRIMRREETPDGAEITPLFGSECDRVTPACDATDGDDWFQGASVDGSRVYFLSSRQLADSDLDGGAFGGCTGFFLGGCDLYLYDASLPEGERLVQVSAGDATDATPGAGAGVVDGVAAISGDGSHVYFLATGVLTADPSPTGATAVEGERNLYLYQRDDEYPNGRLAFIGSVHPNDSELSSNWGTFKDAVYPVPAVGENGEGDEVGGDGRTLAFISRAPFTADDSDGGQIDLFLYDSAADGLVRVSKAAPGGADNGPFHVSTSAVAAGSADRIGTDFAELSRWVSEDAGTVVFKTAEALAADDTNGIFDTYMWRDGTLYRLPGSGTPNVSQLEGDRQASVSHDGSVVAYVAVERVLPQDGDFAGDVYVARVNGGFDQPDPIVDCDPLAGGACPGGGAGEVGSQTKTGNPSDGNAIPAGRVRVSVAAPSTAQRKRAARRGVLALRVRAQGAERVQAVARGRIGKRLRRLGRASKAVTGSGVTRLRLSLSRPARRRLARGHGLRLSIAVTADGARQRTLTVRLVGASR